MNNDRDLLPWILGGLSIAAVAVAVVVASSSPPSPSAAATPRQGSPQALPVARLAPLPATPSQAPSSPDPVQTSAPAPLIASSGQIWACTSNGQKTFSNNPCGDKSTLLDLGPVNTMDRPPLYRSAQGYPSGGYAGPSYFSGEAEPQDFGDTGYSSTVAVPVFVHRYPPHTYRPSNHEHSGVARKY